MRHEITVEVDTDNPELAEKVRDEISGAVEDYIDSFRPAYMIHVGDVQRRSDPTALELAVIEAARRIHAQGSDNEVEIYDDAVVSHGEDGYWVRAAVWVGHIEIPPTPLEDGREPPRMGYSMFKTHYIEGQARAGQKWTMGGLRNAWLAYKDGAE